MLGIQDLSINDVNLILDEAHTFIKVNQSKNKKIDVLRGKTQINLFFEPSTRTQSSFELAGKRLGADVMSMNISNSAIKKGETLIDTAMTLNAKLLVTASCGYEPGRTVHYKPLVNKALELANHKPDKCIIFQREKDKAEH